MCFMTNVYEESYKSSDKGGDVGTEEPLERAKMKPVSKKESTRYHRPKPDESSICQRRLTK